MKVKPQILTEALRFSRTRNNIDLHPEWGNYHHFSFLIWGGKILTWGTNKRDGCSHIKFGYLERSKVHAEYEAVRKAKFWADLSESVIVNVRLNKLNQTKMSAPCKSCKAYLKSQSISTVYYTIENDEFEKLTL
jgi:hypothetical protein